MVVLLLLQHPRRHLALTPQEKKAVSQSLNERQGRACCSIRPWQATLPSTGAWLCGENLVESLTTLSRGAGEELSSIGAPDVAGKPEQQGGKPGS